MGAMMWLMMKGDKSGPAEASASAQQVELARLRAEVDQLRAAQRSGAQAPDDGPVSLGKTTGALR
jgi:hypothetical protein